MEIGEVKTRWKEYVEELYDKEGKPKTDDIVFEDECQVDLDKRGPSLLKEEILAAIQEIKKGKAVGVDDISAEFLMLMNEDNIEILSAYKLN